jgi:hypothetical protein
MSEWSIDDTQCFAIKNGVIYEVIGRCQYPTLIFQNIKTGEISHHVPTALNTKEFVKLIQEDSCPERSYEP